MTFFSRCDAPQTIATTVRSASSRQTGHPASDSGAWASILGFAEDLGILFQYAVGLDYYGRGRKGQRR